MSFDFDETNPLDNSIVANYPANERGARSAMQQSMDIEHEHSSGRHKFPMLTTASRDAITDFELGALVMNIDTTPAVIQRCTATGSPATFENLDVSQTDIVRNDEKNQFTVTQLASWDLIPPLVGTPYTVAIDLDLSPFKEVFIAQDSEIQLPTNTVADHSTIVTLLVIMDGIGGHTITHESPGFYAPAGTINYATGPSERTLVTMVQDRQGNWILSTVPNYFTAVT